MEREGEIMSELRPTLTTGSKKPLMKDGTAYLLIYNAVKESRGLIHGKLHANGEHCAIGNYFEVHDNTSLPNDMIDEVAAVNDSVPHASMRTRRQVVMKWLRWRLAALGMPGYEPKPAKAK